MGWGLCPALDAVSILVSFGGDVVSLGPPSPPQSTGHCPTWPLVRQALAMPVVCPPGLAMSTSACAHCTETATKGLLS